MYNVEEAVQKVVEIFDEAKKRNYDNFILEYDLKTFMSTLLSKTSSYWEDYYEGDYDSGYEEGKEQGYDDGYEEGTKDGEQSGKEELLERIANFIGDLKEEWDTISKDQIRQKLTEYLVILDNEIN